MWAMGPDLRHARRRQRLLLLLLRPALLLLPGRCRGALEHLPYDRLDDMRPLVDDAGRALTTAQVDRKGVGNWSWIFERLIRSRSSQSRFPTAAEGRQKFFDKVVCIGMMKSGTTSIGVAHPRPIPADAPARYEQRRCERAAVERGSQERSAATASVEAQRRRHASLCHDMILSRPAIATAAPKPMDVSMRRSS